MCVHATYEYLFLYPTYENDLDQFPATRYRSVFSKE